jgi:hypothetical protein
MRLIAVVVIALVATTMAAGPTFAHHKPGHKTPPGQGPGPKTPKPKPPKPKPPKPPKKPGTGVHDNRGTIKVHEGAGEPPSEMRNEPQVCDFHIHMFKFHAGQTLTISIVGHGGNAGPSTYADTVTTDANGDARSPATGAITTFADGTYKVSVDTGRGGPGKQDKHKVLKVDCTDDSPPAPEPPPGGGDGDQPNPGGNNQDGTNPGGDQPNPGGDEVAGPDAPAPGSGPETGQPPDNAPVVPPKPGDLPDTAMAENTASSVPLLGLIAMLLAATGALAVRARRRVTTS